MNLKVKINGKPAELEIPDSEIQRIVGVRVFVDKRELSQKINKSIATINRLMKENLIPFMKDGKSVTFDLAEVQEHMRRHWTVKSILR